ncbi:MAG: antibiotic biosynthesis monooxygenase [Thermoplasmata archaeon]
MIFSYVARARPKRGMEQMVQAGMQAFAEFMATQPGLLSLHFLKDSENRELVGISFWERKEDWQTAMGLSMQARQAESHNEIVADPLAAALERPLEAHEYEVIWERRK